MFDLKTERKIVVLLCAVNFANVLDFMMVMPLGPDFSKALGIPSSHLGWIGGSYTAAASVAGVVGSFFLDRFDRRKALAYSILGLSIATLAAGFAYDFYTLLLARIIAGIFGGPAASLAFSIVSDITPVSRRGRAVGAVMSSFSLASIIGVPIGLEMARVGSWNTPFFAVGGVMLLMNLMCFLMIPPITGHLKDRDLKTGTLQSTVNLFKMPEVWFSYLCISASMFAAFMLIPNFSAYFQFNLGFPREKLGFLYLVGGLVSFFLMQISGRMVDRFGATVVGIFATLLLLGTLYGGYYRFPPLLPHFVIFTGFMAAMSIRGVVVGSLASRVPTSATRARFMSFQSAVQHASSALGAFFSSLVLTETMSGSLVGMPLLALCSMATSLLIPVAVILVERKVRCKESLIPAN
jgi:predicted MFS family arabinose efflux permease